jgi:LuxR family maltose regulon positive regulatory protein
MPETLVRTKLIVPPLRPNLLARPRLIERLNHGLQPGLKVTLVSAPAGYGKTTVLTQWVRSRNTPIGWLSLDRSDNDFERFFRYLVMAWEAVQPGIRHSPLDTLLGSMAPDNEAVLAAFINVANEVPDDTALVLNDYHLIEEPSIHNALTFLIDHLPPKLHFVLASRGEPQLPLARYRARGELQEIGVEDLRFHPEEVRDLLNKSMGIALPPEEIESLGAQLEGWIVGLQMAAVALRRGLVKSDRLAVDGRQRFIADYLRSEVLADLPQKTRHFLLETSILERLCGPLSEAITEEEGGQAMLETLEREGLFLSPLDDRREWFRYHPLFADFLGEELNRRHPDKVAEIHSRAAHWYLAQGLFEPAFEHAVEGHTGQLVAQIAERRFELMLHTGQLKLLGRWLDALPEAWQFQYPVIGLAKAAWLGMSGDMVACLSQVDKVERAVLQPEREDRRWQMARVNTVRCQIACFQNNLAKAEPLAERALQDLPESDRHYRANIHHSMGEAYRHVGRWQEAREHYNMVLALVQDPAFRLRTTHVYGALADVELRQGRLRDAARFWDKSLSVIKERDSWGFLPLPLTGWVYIRMAEIQYEWNELQTAAGLVEGGLERAELGGVVQALIVGYLIAGRLQLTRGDATAAVDYLERARPHLENAQFHHWIGRFERLQLELWLAQDKLRTAVNWSDEMLQDDALATRPQYEIAYLAVARVLIFKGDRAALRQALTLLEQLEPTAGAEGRTAVQVEALALQGLAFQKRGDEAKAMTAIERALRLAEPEGYMRLFVDLGQGMARLLQATRSRKVMPAYVKRLLTAFGDDWLAVGARPLPEPMTKRETEILKLIAAGLTNREIAAQLIISPETVKKHAGNIYSKLYVASRTEAAAIARELDLLD